jgi:CheY-like chemotaxis protein
MAHILIVDDDSPIRILLGAILRRDGHEVSEAADGAEALALMEQTEFDVILLDLMMPRMSGGDLLDRLAEQPNRRRNVIVITAANEKQIRGVNNARVRAVIRKPFDLTHLRNEVRGATERHLLLVEDDEAECYLAQRALAASGYTITTAGDGRDALQALASRNFDALVVDLRLPTISGYDVIDHVASRPGRPPIIVLTVLDEPEREIVADAYLHKPEGMAHLLPTLQSLTL